MIFKKLASACAVAGAIAAAASALAQQTIRFTAPGVEPSALTFEVVNPDLCLWYAQPAQKWEEALPVGSGRLGAMIFGGTASERVQFNEDTLWTGVPRSYVRPGAGDNLEQIRQLIFEGKQDEAADLFRATMISKPVRQKAYQPFGDLRFTFPGHEAAADYRRILDLDSAIATTVYRVDGVEYRREVFASYPDNVIAVRITASKPGALTFSLRMDSPHEVHRRHSLGDNVLVLTGQVLDKARNIEVPNEPGTRFESRARILHTGGTLSISDAVATVENADSATILLVAATSFVNFQDASADPAERAQAYLAHLDTRSYDALRETHLADHRNLFRRVSIDLGRSENANLPTDQRVQRAKKAANPTNSTEKNPPMPEALPAYGLDSDPALASLFFQYGRYMLIGASRPGTQAANLQGVWNELLDPPWESKYTTNINFEMNYWPAEVTNLSELHGPMFDMIDDLRVSGAITAQEQYGARGWVLHHNTDIWRGTAPINNIDGMWPTGGAWLSHHMWEHYQYSGDKEFLARRAYPAMKEACEFFLDFLVPHPESGLLVTNPSHSPEQGPLNAGPAMDMQLIRALFDYTVEATRILDIDHDFARKLIETRARLVPDQVGKHGQLQEWKEDWDEPNNNHRHMSPLWGLFPGSQFTPQGDPKIYEAAKLLLAWRGDGSTGWSFAWRIPLWARVGDGNFAYRQLALLMGRRVLPNLFDLCGPFQADGNYGATGGIAEMLMQSHLRVPTADGSPSNTYIIDLLPALPDIWRAGSISGLRARGGFEVGFAWKQGKLESATLKSLLGNPVRVRSGGQAVDLETTAGQVINLSADLTVKP